MYDRYKMMDLLPFVTHTHLFHFVLFFLSFIFLLLLLLSVCPNFDFTGDYRGIYYLTKTFDANRGQSLASDGGLELLRNRMLRIITITFWKQYIHFG